MGRVRRCQRKHLQLHLQILPFAFAPGQRRQTVLRDADQVRQRRGFSAVGIFIQTRQGHVEGTKARRLGRAVQDFPGRLMCSAESRISS